MYHQRLFHQRVLLPLLLLASLTTSQLACQKNLVTAHPNQLSTLDGQAYDLLYTAQAALQEAQKQFQAGNIPQSAKPVYTVAAAAYNDCEAAWKTYRAVLAGTQSGDLTQYTQALTDQMKILNDSILALQKLGGK